MRIGLMLRTMDEKQGIGVYTQNLVDELLRQDPNDAFVLFYRTEEFLGRYTAHANVREVVLPAGNKLVWDQWIMPRAARREKLDVLFHTKFTVPLLAPCPSIMSIHGASWFVHPELYSRADVAYIRAVMPLYCRKAAHIVSNSQLTTNDYKRILKVSDDRITTIHLGRNESFRVMDDRDQLEAVRRRYGLPPKFVFAVAKYDPRKNVKNLLAGFRQLRKHTDARLVMAGIGCEKYREEFRLDEDGTGDAVTFLGWVDQAELPALYNLAHCMLFPSVYEEFGIPTCEAMACGCPSVIARTGALPEIAGDAALQVDPFDPMDIAAALERVWSDDELCADLRRRSLKRAEHFTWERCARETLEVIHRVGSRGRG